MSFKGSIPWNKGIKGYSLPKGRKLTEEHKRIISSKNKGNKPWNKGMKGKQFAHWLGKKRSTLTKQRMSKSLTGRAISIETRLKIGQALKGAKSHLWKGGKTKETLKIRSSIEYRLWRLSVFERDNYTCRFCNIRGGKLEADHIKPFAYFPELRLAIDNGRTLCHDCHTKTETYKRNIK